MHALQQHSKYYPALRQAEGRIGSRKGKTKKRTDTAIGHAFLNTTFLPITIIPKSLKHTARVEQEYYRSLRNLCSLYGLDIMEDEGHRFPLNILHTYGEAVKQLEQKAPLLQCHLIQDGKRRICIATAKEFNPGTKLYYIPVRPIWSLFRNREKMTANLLLSICACLYRAGICSYHDGFVGQTYETLIEWTEQHIYEYGEDENNCLSDLKMAAHFGKWWDRQVVHPYHSDNFLYRLSQYKPNTELENGIYALAKAFADILHKFPDRNLHDNMHGELFGDTDDDGDEYTSPDQYLSFFWDDCESFYHSFWETINCSLQEHVDMIVPTAIQYFDTPQETECHTIDYEKSMFGFIEEFCNLLYQLS